MYPASWWRIALRALDDDPHVSVLINRSVTRAALSPAGFPTRRWTVVSSSSLLSRPWWNVVQSSSSWRWKSGKRLVLSKRSVFSTATSGGDLQRLVLIVLAAGQHSPGDASQLVGDRDHDLITRRPLGEPVHPLPESSCVVLDAQQHRADTVDQHATQIDVASFADAEQLLLAPGGVLPWHHAHPGREVTSPAKSSPIADGGHGCSGDQRAKAGDLAQPPAFLRRWMGRAAKVRPRSSRNPRISLISAVRRWTSRSRTRCRACQSSCSWVLICTKRMFCLVTASPIASASMKSFLFDFR